jgi:PncC family amidohydrolase
MQTLLPLAAQLAAKLKERGETIAIGESSAGGLIAASLLAQPGASAFFRGAAVVYTRQAREGLLGITAADMTGMRSASEPYALLQARRLITRLGAIWGLVETGAAGPTGNSYGDAAGHSCFAVAGPREFTCTLATGSADRQHNMRAFAARALAVMLDALQHDVP